MTEYKLFFNLVFLLPFLTVFNPTDLHSQSNSVIGLTVEFSAPIGPVETADKIYFIKIKEDTSNLEVESVIQTNFQIDNQIYLTDIEPGEYAIIAIGKEKLLPFHGLTNFITFFSKELIKENTVTVHSNDFVYMGNYSVKSKLMMPNKKYDDSQFHYFKLITGRKSVPCYMHQVFLDTCFYRASIENIEINMTDKGDFYIKALKHFQGLEQEEIIRTKIDK